MRVGHFMPSLSVTVNPDDVLSGWHPFGVDFAFTHQYSASIGIVKMTPTSVSTYVNRSRRCSYVNWDSFEELMMTRPPMISTRTRVRNSLQDRAFWFAIWLLDLCPDTGFERFVDKYGIDSVGPLIPVEEDVFWTPQGESLNRSILKFQNLPQLSKLDNYPPQ